MLVKEDVDKKEKELLAKLDDEWDKLKRIILENEVHSSRMLDKLHVGVGVGIIELYEFRDTVKKLETF